MGYSSNTREFLRGNQPENLPFLLKHYTGILQYRFTLRSQLGTVKKKSKVWKKTKKNEQITIVLGKDSHLCACESLIRGVYWIILYKDLL